MVSRHFLSFDEGMITASKLRNNMSEVIQRVVHQEVRVLVTRHDRPVVAMCTVKDLEMVREWFRKTAREKELEMEIAYDAWTRAREAGPGTRYGPF